MNDLDKFIELYESIGIKLIPEEVNKDIIRLTITQNLDWDRIGGYSSFFSTIDFDSTGKFKEQNFWE